MSFFLLGLSFSAVGLFFQDVRHILLIVCGVLIILMGLFQIGLIRIPFLQKERKLSARINLKKMNPGVAFVLGFLFSFAWTPCVGPALSSVLMMASSGSSSSTSELTTPPDLQLSDYQGNTYRLSDYSSQTVVLNFWSLSCNICKEELNSIQRL